MAKMKYWYLVKDCTIMDKMKNEVIKKELKIFNLNTITQC